MITNSRQLETIPQPVLDALSALDCLGFDDEEEALDAIIQHADWTDRWDVNDGDISNSSIINSFIRNGS